MIAFRKFAIAAGCLTVVAAASVSLWSRALAPTDPGGPELEFVETEFDFGEVNEGDVVTHSFKFDNAGAEELRIDPIVVGTVHASCSLPNALTVSVPSFSDTDTVVVAPGGANEVVLRLDTEGFAMKEFDGSFSQRVRIFSNDPHRPRTVLRLHGTIRPIVVRDPVEIQMGTVFKANGELPAELRPVRLMPTAGNQVRITKVEASVPFLKPTVAETGDGYVVTTAIDPSIPEGTLEDVHLTVHTDHPKKPTIVIPVSAAVYAKRPILASPQVARFGFVQPGEALTSTVRLERVSDASWNVLKVVSKADGVTVDTSTQRSADGHNLTIAIKAPRAWSSVTGTIEVTTDSKTQPKIMVPFAGWTVGDAPFSIKEPDLRAFVTAVLGDDLLTNPEEVIAKVFGGADDWRGFGVLAAIARDEAAVVQARVTAVDLMKLYSGAAMLETLESIVNSDIEEMVRDSALSLYAELVGAKAFPLLIERLNDKSEWVRQTAATALGELRDERAKAALLKATRDPRPDVVLAAVEALEQFFPDTQQKGRQ